MPTLSTGEFQVDLSGGGSTEFVAGHTTTPLDIPGLPKGIFTLDPNSGTEEGRRVSASPSRHLSTSY